MSNNEATYDPITALAAREVFALINKDAPYPPSEEPIDHYGPYGYVIAEFRMLHRQARDIWARGEMCDPWYDAGLLWDGYRQEAGGDIDYKALDDLVRRIGGLPPSKAGKIEYITGLSPISGSALMAKNIPPTRHFVKNIIRTGLCFFIGQPGVGKTPALVQLAIAYATGGLWLGIFRVPKIKVAYIGPEYDEGDTRNTIMESTGGRANLDNLLVFTVENFVGPNSEEEAMRLIDDLVKIHHVEALIIDLFTGFLPPEKFKQNAYRGDYREFLAYHRAALAHNISIVGAWHGTKRDANPATMYNGGQGFWGSAGGGRLVMYQDDTDQVKLYTQLRGSKAMTYSLTEAFIAGCRIWATVEGSEPEPAFGSDVHRAVYYIVKEHAPLNGISPKTIYSLVKPELEKNVSEAYVRKCIAVLTRRGLLRAIGDGYVIQTGRSEGSRGTQRIGGSGGSGGSESDFNDTFTDVGPFSESPIPSDPSPIPVPIPTDSASYSGESSTDPADPQKLLDADIFAPISLSNGVTLRIYLRSNMDSDQERAREICQLYGIDYAKARASVLGQSGEGCKENVSDL